MVERVPILEMNKRKIREYFTATWYFETFFEKTILIVLSLCGAIRIVQWIV